MSAGPGSDKAEILALEGEIDSVAGRLDAELTT